MNNQIDFCVALITNPNCQGALKTFNKVVLTFGLPIFIFLKDRTDYIKDSWNFLRHRTTACLTHSVTGDFTSEPGNRNDFLSRSHHPCMAVRGKDSWASPCIEPVAYIVFQTIIHTFPWLKIFQNLYLVINISS